MVNISINFVNFILHNQLSHSGNLIQHKCSFLFIVFELILRPFSFFYKKEKNFSIKRAFLAPKHSQTIPVGLLKWSMMNRFNISGHAHKRAN
ncbi:hypothetical protein AsAng_0009260 [Aureispira anguillae]|uniref:Uncharacterized protein n=1 Tax=Aureispira anguillae TaxID=2864201 RepID=A0A915YBU9_9BACT|nr:hypothetical protein AsAng_0009260 [Aureispira anguillae]